MNKLTEWLVKPFIKEEFGAPAGILPSPSQEKRKKAKKRLDKTGQRSVYSDSEIGESLPIKVTDKIKKVKNKPETDAEKDFSKHHKYSLSAPMGSLSEPDTYDWDDDYKEKGGHQKEKDKKKKGYEPVKEATEKITKVVGIYGGRFQPFGPHHKKTYDWLKSRVDDAYITTSNIKQPPRHPMNFSEKVRHMVKMGIPKNRIIQEKSPYVAKNVLKKYNKDTTAVIYMFGAKDAGRLSGGKYFQDYKKNKNKMNGYEDNGYVLTAPHVSIKVGGKEVSGTVMRDLLGSPKYEKNSKRLSWAFLLLDDDSNNKIVNYETRILGRNGVMSVTLVTSPENLNRSIIELNNSLSTFKFNSGERYSEYKKGDRVAEFGLAALIAGGAAAVASKKGLWAILMGLLIAAKKFAFVIIIGLFAGIASLFKRKK